MPTTSEYHRIAPPLLQQWTASILECYSVPAPDAGLAADVLVSTSTRGVDTHGIVRLPIYVRRLQAGEINPGPEILVEALGPAVTRVDGDNGLGLVVGARAMELAIAQARESGAAVAGVRNSGHFGAAAYYALLAASRGLIGISMTNAEPSMAPWGSSTRYIGNNPLAFAAPGGVVLDMATSQVAWGKVMLAARARQKIPLTWATDLNGQPTDDPQKGMDGLMLPLGGYKGFALAMMIEVLCGVLTGALTGTRIGADEQGLGHFFLAIDVERFMPLSEFQARLSQMVAEIHACQPLEGAGEILAPGELEARTAAERARHGIPLSPDVVRDLRALGAESGIPLPF